MARIAYLLNLQVFTALLHFSTFGNGLALVHRRKQICSGFQPLIHPASEGW